MSQKELEIIKDALLIENEGYQFYKMAAEQSKSKEEREAFNKLADEERKHIEYLKELYEGLDEDKEIDIFDISAPKSPGLFDWDKVNNKKGSMALSVFGIGVKFEKEAVDFYKEAVEKSDSPEAKKLYEVLIDWEKQHLNDFQKQYDLLKEDWWHEQGFAPF